MAILAAALFVVALLAAALLAAALLAAALLAAALPYVVSNSWRFANSISGLLLKGSLIFHQ